LESAFTVGAKQALGTLPALRADPHTEVEFIDFAGARDACVIVALDEPQELAEAEGGQFYSLDDVTEEMRAAGRLPQ
jgi:NAD(P)H-flavin reductase